MMWRLKFHVIVGKKGIKSESIEEMPERLNFGVFIPRWMRMEKIIKAFMNGDRKMLYLVLMDDPRTTSYEQACDLINHLLALPWNSEAEKHYR